MKKLFVVNTPDIFQATPSGLHTVVVALDRQLLSKPHYRRLAISYAALDITRREFPNELADTIYGFEGVILNPNGSVFELGDTDIDDAFGNDLSFRWLSDFKKHADLELLQRPQYRLLPRLRLIDLYFRIAHPERAEQIAK